MPLYISPPPSNPFTRVLMALAGLLVLIGSFMLGMVALVVALSLGLLAGIVVWLRLVWIRRKLKKEGVSAFTAQAGVRSADGDALEAEYTVVESRRDP